MSVSSAFQDFQTTVNASEEQVADARERRDLFKVAFGAETDVDDVIASGSLRRGTQKGPHPRRRHDHRFRRRRTPRVGQPRHFGGGRSQLHPGKGHCSARGRRVSRGWTGEVHALA
jgi:hypothetical protein